jgi:hypothetical protein
MYKNNFLLKLPRPNRANSSLTFVLVSGIQMRNKEVKVKETAGSGEQGPDLPPFVLYHDQTSLLNTFKEKLLNFKFIDLRKTKIS